CVWLEDYGRSLVMEIDYSVGLERMSSTKIWSLMKDALSSPGVEEQIAAGRYGALRTKASYKRCVELAYDRYGWTQEST
ncbi:MAG TPA: hypothetical protein VMK12_18845, partial [Anaeromyxobacteraceae bacterium]|nr:hypothetical protein [Anaeromyxobacteraceae bacterium]